MKPITTNGWILIGLAVAYCALLWCIRAPDPKDRYQMFVENPNIVFRLDKSSGRMERYLINSPTDVDVVEITSFRHTKEFRELMKEPVSK